MKKGVCTFCQQKIAPGAFFFKGPAAGRLCQDCLGLAALSFQTWREQDRPDLAGAGPDYSDYFQTEAWRKAKAGLEQGAHALEELAEGIPGLNPEDFE